MMIVLIRKTMTQNYSMVSEGNPKANAKLWRWSVGILDQRPGEMDMDPYEGLHL